MQPKRVTDDSGLFCGYLFGHESPALNPDTVLHRAFNGVALGRNDRDYWRSIQDAINESSMAFPDHPSLKAASTLHSAVRKI